MTVMRTQQVPLSSQDITETEIEAVVAVLRGERLSIGPRLEAFESAVAARAGRRYAVGVNSGTSALHLCVKALGIAPGDEVITTPFSFIATTNCVLFERARPVLVDIDPDSYNMDPSAIEAAITPRTAALLPVEVFGNLAHFQQYEQIAERHSLALIEDCCEALGGSLRGRPAGSFGECGAFAFYPNKQITTGEGGMLVTDREDIRDAARSLRNQGRSGSDWLSHARMGYNYRLSEIASVLGEAQMARLDEILCRRRAVAALYHDALADLSDVRRPPMSEPANASWFVYVVRLADRFTARDRNAILARLREAGVGCNNYFSPIHLQPYIRELLRTHEGQFPVTEHVAARTIALPFFTRMTQSQVACVRDALADAIRRSK